MSYPTHWTTEAVPRSIPTATVKRNPASSKRKATLPGPIFRGPNYPLVDSGDRAKKRRWGPVGPLGPTRGPLGPTTTPPFPGPPGPHHARRPEPTAAPLNQSSPCKNRRPPERKPKGQKPVLFGPPSVGLRSCPFGPCPFGPQGLEYLQQEPLGMPSASAMTWEATGWLPPCLVRWTRAETAWQAACGTFIGTSAWFPATAPGRFPKPEQRFAQEGDR